jgi:hypothetical protein
LFGTVAIILMTRQLRYAYLIKTDGAEPCDYLP